MCRRPIARAMVLLVAIGGVQRLQAMMWASASRAPTPIWRIDAQARGVPAASGSTVFFLTKRHEVVAVNALSGTIVWRAPTRGAGEETYGTALVPERSVVVAGDYDLIAFDAVTGIERWRFAPSIGYGPGIYLGEAADGRVFAGSPAGRLYAVDVKDGSCAWSATVMPGTTTTVFAPVVAGDVTIAGYTTFAPEVSGGVVAFDRATGRERWKRVLGTGDRGAAFGAGLVANGGLLIASAGDGMIHAFDKDTGAPRWSLPGVGRFPGQADAGRDLRPLAAAGRMLYAGSLAGTVVAYDIAEQRERWRRTHEGGGSTGLQLTIDGQTLYVPHLGGLLLALDADTGAERWRIGDLSSGFMWAPLVAVDRVFVGASTAGFHAFPRGDAQPD